MPAKKSSAKVPKKEKGTVLKKDVQVVMPNGKSKMLRAGCIYKNLPDSVLDQI